MFNARSLAQIGIATVVAAAIIGVTMVLAPPSGTSLGAEQIPTWPGGVSCKSRGSQAILFDAYATAPKGAEGLASGTPENSCSMICLPAGLQNVAAKHGVHYGSSCFDDEICPGAKYINEGAQAGVQFFRYDCTEGNAVDYGPPYK